MGNLVTMGLGGAHTAILLTDSSFVVTMSELTVTAVIDDLDVEVTID
jgi:hypothetical protein